MNDPAPAEAYLPGYVAENLPWSAENGVAVAMKAAQAISRKDTLPVELAALALAEPESPAIARITADVPALAGLNCYSLAHVATSEVQGATFDPADGLAYACFALDQPENCRTIGIAWFSPPTELADYYIGIGDRVKGRWHWYYGPNDFVITYDPAEANVVAGDPLLVAVAVGAGLPADFRTVATGVSETRATGGLAAPTSESAGEAVEQETEEKYTSALPHIVDLRPFGTPVGDQGILGSCAAFAVGNGVYNIQLQQLYGQYGWDVNDTGMEISPLWVYVKSGLPPYGNYNPPCGSTVGRSLDEVFELLWSTGAATERAVPYDDNLDCITVFSGTAYEEASHLQISGWHMLPSSGMVRRIKEQLALFHRPVAVMLQGLESGFTTYQDGVYHYGGTSGADTGHAVCITGYDETLQAFQVRNSWGDNWGLDGYCNFGYDAVSDLSALGRFSAYYMVLKESPATLEYFLNLADPYDFDLHEPNNTVLSATELPTPSFLGFQSGFVTDDWFDVFHFAYTPGTKLLLEVLFDPDEVHLTASLLDEDGHLMSYLTGSGGEKTISGKWESVHPAYLVVENQSNGTGIYTINAGIMSQPAAPVHVAASQGLAGPGVEVSWIEEADAIQYYVQRSLKPDGTFFTIRTCADSPHRDTLAVAWQPYWYRVIAVNEYGVSAPSAAVLGYVGAAAPNQPGTVVTSEDDCIAVWWTAEPADYPYGVLRSIAADGPYALLATCEEYPYLDYSAIPGVVYYYAICLERNGLLGELSLPASGSLPLPALDSVRVEPVSDPLIVYGWEGVEPPLIAW
ncbi:hypothetical protein JW859_13705 [bacterium]|nr:hypothetical protein [bacterium]